METTIQKEEDTNLNILIKHAKELSDYSFNEEEKREQSLINQSGKMLTYISIYSAILLMLTPILLEYVKRLTLYILICLIIILLLLFSNMVLLLFAQWRYKYKNFPSPINIYNHIMENSTFFESQEQRDKAFIETLNETYLSKKKLNDKRANLIIASMIVSLCSICIFVFAILFGIIFLVK